ncbi:hypothetical protein FRC20_001166 [Serendipita sp. 405]|nr:hypothetical protein FRC20_001166 [Serendipita sp. 405]
MSRFSLRRSLIGITKGPKENYLILPDELWIPILTVALEPVLILDEYCFSFNIEQFYYATTSPESTSSAKVAATGARRMRRSLCLVCRRFNNIMHSIPKRDDHIWLRMVDNEPRTYRAPLLRWQYPWIDGQNTTYGRLDVKWTFEHTHYTNSSCMSSVSTYRLFIKRVNAGIETFAQFSSLPSLVRKCDALRAVHLGLEHCAPAPGIQHPTEMAGELFSDLGTLSLSFGANTARDVLYLHFSLPCLRNLFLKFPQFGIEDSALDGWVLPSLTIFSFHSVIGQYGIEPLAVMPPFLSTFLAKYGSQLSGLRLVPGPWGFSANSGCVLPMEVNQTCDLWRRFDNIKVLSMDLRFLREHIESSRIKARESIQVMLSRLEHLTHVESARLESSFSGIQSALSLCAPDLETLTIVASDGSRLGTSWLTWGRHSSLLERLIKECAVKSVNLLDVHGKPLTMATILS